MKGDPKAHNRLIFQHHQTTVEEVTFPNNPSSKKFLLINLGDGVGVVPITIDSKILLVNEYKLGQEENQWNIPSGGVKKGEKPEEALYRELEEETNAMGNKLEYLGKFNALPSHLKGRLDYYILHDVKDYSLPKGDEIDKIKAFSGNEIFKLIENEELTHTGSIAALLLTFHRYPELIQ